MVHRQHHHRQRPMASESRCNNSCRYVSKAREPLVERTAQRVVVDLEHDASHSERQLKAGGFRVIEFTLRLFVFRTLLEDDESAVQAFVDTAGSHWR